MNVLEEHKEVGKCKKANCSADEPNSQESAMETSHELHEFNLPLSLGSSYVLYSHLCLGFEIIFSF
jgi:hypothetical protein